MSTLDVRESEKISEIQWCENIRWNLVKKDVANGIRFKDSSVCKSLVSTKENAQDLIKALEKAIELGWVK